MTYIGLLGDSPFPIMTTDAAMRMAVADREEIRFMTQPNGTTVCSYIIAGADTFRDSYSREARGIVFDANGKVIARPLHKFFNVNERAETQVSAIDWSKISRVMLKRDGSMIHTVAFPEDGRNFTLKSKKSYTSDVAIQSKKWMLQRENFVRFCTDMTNQGMTAIFEWTSPTARIVVGYKQDEMQLLHVRCNDTGVYLNQTELEALTAKYDIPLVETVEIIPRGYEPAFPQDYIRELVETTEDIEGWVIQFQNGEMVKLKTKWYMDRHHAMTFLRERDIARMVVDETLDDLKAKLVGDGIDIAQILEIERRVVEQIELLERSVNELFKTTEGKDRKTVALEHRSHPHFSMLMQKFSGKEPDVKAFFERHMLDSMFTLTQLNLTDSVAEVE